MKVTVGVIAYNEEKYLPYILSNLNCQTYPHGEIEIILVDGISRDNTKKLMQEFSNKNDFWKVKIIDNPKKVQPAGWNIVIDNSEGDIIIRLDAHAIISNDFVQKNVNCIESGESVCGGTLIQKIDSKKRTARMFLTAETSMFGSSPATFRRKSNYAYVKTLALGCYKKEVFQKVGKFNENLLRAEDNDMHYRVSKAGYKLCLIGDLHYEYWVRPTLKGLIKQKYNNGKWIGITSVRKTPAIFSLYHFVPCLFVLSLFASMVTAILASIFPQESLMFCSPLIILLSAYGILIGSITIYEAIKAKDWLIFFALPIVISLLHLSYGIGTIVGMLQGPFKKMLM